MKNKIQIMFVRGLQKALNHDNGPRLPRHWKVIASTLLLLFTFAIGNVWGADPIPTITWDGTSLTGAVSSTTNITAGTATAVNGSTYKAGTISISSSKIVTESKKHTNDTYWEDFSASEQRQEGGVSATGTARIELPFTVAEGYTFTISDVGYKMEQGGGGGPAVHAFIVQGSTATWLNYTTASTIALTGKSIALSAGSAKLVFVLGVESNLNNGRQFKFSGISIKGTVAAAGGSGSGGGEDPGETPTTYAVTHTLSNNIKAVSGEAGDNKATEGTAYEATFGVDALGLGTTLPSTITVTIGGNPATVSEDYAWNATTGEFSVPGEKVTGAIVVTVAGVNPVQTFKSDFTDFTQVGESDSYYTYLTQTNYAAYATTGWMKYVGNSTGDTKLLINPATDGAISPSSNSKYGKVKQEGSKYMEFYVTGITSVKFYFHNGGSDARTARYKLNNDSETDLVTITNGTSNFGSIALNSSTNNTIRVYASGDVYLCAMKVTLPASSCAATAPGNISKSEASGGTGKITLTAAGSPASGDKWYWQSSASGEDDSDEYDAENGKEVSAAGTYYLRSYNTAGNCWSSAKSVTVEEADLLTAISPTLSYAANVFVGGTLSPTLEGNTGSGSVSYELNDVTPAGCMTIDEAGVVTAVAPGTATVTATIAKSGYYAGNTATSGTITVVPAPTHMVENRLNVTSGDWSSTIYTNDGTNISNLVQWQIAAGQDRTAGVTDKQSIKNNRTHGIGTTSEKVDGYYMYLSFKVADGKRLKLSAVNIPVFGISANKTTLVEIEDANSTKISVNGTITADNDGNGFGSYTFSEAPYLKGVVTMKMWAYGATSGYRMKSPIYLDGVISDIPTPAAPTISAPDEDQAAVYDLNDAITPLSITASGYPAPTYQWYKNSSASTEGATAIDGAESASYTPANNVASNFYYYCVATNVSGSATSHYFHVTVNACTPPTTPASLTATKTHTTANLSWSAANANGYKIALVSASGDGTFDWKDEASNAYEATGLTPETAYTFKVKSIGGTGQCEFSDEATVEFTTNAIPTYDVTFNMNDHGAAIAKQTITEGEKATAPYVADVDGWVFGGWYTDNGTFESLFDFANTTINAATPLYAKWTADACAGDRKSLSKVVLTSASAGTVTGYNGSEFAGSAVIGGLSDSGVEADLGSGNVTGYKLNNGGSAIVFATLKKGSFQAGDKVVIGITKKQDSYKINSVGQPVLRVYFGTNASDAALLTTIENVSAAGYYTYRLTEADVTAIGSKKGIGLFRESSNGQNPYVYSVEITGCRDWTVTHDVTFDMKDHGTQVAKQTLEVGAKVTEPDEPEAAGYIFGGWYKETTLENKWNFSTDVVPDNDITLYAKWTEDPCTDRQSLSKVVLTSTSDGTVTGYNSNEYAGTELIASLSGSKSADLGDGSVTGYKLNNGGSSMLMATLKKGNFQEGDKVTIGIVYQNDQRTVDDSKNIMTIYAGSDASHMMEVTTLTGVTGAGYYTYRLTAADAAAINEAGYKSIGLFRASSNGQNHYVYSVEITGCREWAITHTVTFNKMGKGADIAPAVVAEGDKVTKPTVVEPEGWALAGWYKEEGLVNEWNFDEDVMGEENITLYAKWESEEGVIKLFDGEGNLNTTNFISAAKTTIEINDVEYPTLADFGSNRSSLAQAKQADMVMYSATTDATKIKFELYNANASAKSAYLWLVEEGDDAATAIDVVEVPGNERLTTSYYTFNGTKNRSFYLTSGSKADIKVMQVKVMDNGTAIPQFGKAGYSVDFNKGRIAVASNGTVSFEGASIHSNDEYSVLNNESLKPKTYIQFNNAVANTTVKIKKASSNAYYVTNDLDNKGTSYTTDQEIVMSTTGTWYIGSVNSGSVAALSKIEFIAPKCEAPEFDALANSDICSGDAYVALDGTGTVSDGGSITYKWYAEGDAENVLATTATYTPSADGNYYVVALHHVDGYTDNEATSDVVTVKTYAGTAISEPLADQRGNVDDVVALEVAASGKNLHYAWKECATIDGEYTAVAGAADAASLDVTITEGMDKYYKVIVSSACGDAQESVAHVTQYVPVAQANVTGSIAWNWANAASVNEIKLTASTSPKKNEGFVMANGKATVYNNANFESDKLYLEGEYIVRDGKYFQGQTIKFNTTVAGAVRVKFSHTGNNKPARELYINGVGTGDSRTSATAEWSRYVEVPAGEVTITAYHVDPADGAGQQYIRVPEIEFLTIAHQRTSGYKAGDLGTVCLEDAAVINGAKLYELGGLDGNGYLAFDEITNGKLEAGKPYLFEVTNPSLISFYKQVNAAHADAEIATNGMIGTFSEISLEQDVTENLYYFSGRHIWRVNDFTVSIPIPAHRCYVDMDDVEPAQAPAPGRRRVTLGINGNNAPTDVENVQSDEVQCTKVMINGQMFILRGEKMFDVSGQLIK